MALHCEVLKVWHMLRRTYGQAVAGLRAMKVKVQFSVLHVQTGKQHETVVLMNSTPQKEKHVHWAV